MIYKNFYKNTLHFLNLIFNVDVRERGNSTVGKYVSNNGVYKKDGQ